MVARNTDEPHRASTPLELLFDLCFVVAVSQAARELNDSLSHNHFGSGSSATHGVLRHLVGLGELHLVRLGL
jgi:hypothetical protein